MVIMGHNIHIGEYVVYEHTQVSFIGNGEFYHFIDQQP